MQTSVFEGANGRIQILQNQRKSKINKIRNEGVIETGQLFLRVVAHLYIWTFLQHTKLPILPKEPSFGKIGNVLNDRKSHMYK